MLRIANSDKGVSESRANFWAMGRIPKLSWTNTSARKASGIVKPIFGGEDGFDRSRNSGFLSFETFTTL